MNKAIEVKRDLFTVGCESGGHVPYYIKVGDGHKCYLNATRGNAVENVENGTAGEKMFVDISSTNVFVRYDGKWNSVSKGAVVAALKELEALRLRPTFTKLPPGTYYRSGFGNKTYTQRTADAALRASHDYGHVWTYVPATGLTGAFWTRDTNGWSFSSTSSINDEACFTPEDVFVVIPDPKES